MDFDAQPGDAFETVLLGVLVGDVLRFWRSDGTPELVRVGDADSARALLARGLIARTSPEPGRFREVGFFEPGKNLLMLPGRMLAGPVATRPDGDMLVTTEPTTVNAAASTMTVTPYEPQKPDQSIFDHATEWLTEVVRHSVARGECVVAETGGWDAIPSPYILACALHDADGWTMHLEAEPPPNTTYWPPQGTEVASLSAPLTETQLSVVGILMLDAILALLRSPFNVVLTYVPLTSGTPMSPSTSSRSSGLLRERPRRWWGHLRGRS